MIKVISNINGMILLKILKIILIIMMKIISFLKNLTFKFPSNSVFCGYVWMCYG